MRITAFQLLCNFVVPIAGGVAGALRPSEWHALWQSTWFVGAFVWIGMMLMILLFAESRTKRIVGLAVVTLWVWGVVLSSLFVSQVPDPPRHISPPAHWYRGGNS